MESALFFGLQQPFKIYHISAQPSFSRRINSFKPDVLCTPQLSVFLLLSSQLFVTSSDLFTQDWPQHTSCGPTLLNRIQDHFVYSKLLIEKDPYSHIFQWHDTACSPQINFEYNLQAFIEHIGFCLSSYAPT